MKCNDNCGCCWSSLFTSIIMLALSKLFMLGCDVVQVHEAITTAGGYPSPLNYYNFPKSVCTSINEVSLAVITFHDMP